MRWKNLLIGVPIGIIFGVLVQLLPIIGFFFTSMVGAQIADFIMEVIKDEGND